MASGLCLFAMPPTNRLGRAWYAGTWLFTLALGVWVTLLVLGFAVWGTGTCPPYHGCV
jgi:hypothetical protein